MQNNLSETKQFIIARLEEEYNSKKMIFLIENPDKNEKHFIEQEITIIKKVKDEYDRKSNLTDDEVYEEIKKEKKYLNSDKTATSDEIEDYLKYHLKQHREKYKKSEKEGLRSIFYNTKLKKILEIEKNLNPKKNKSQLLGGKKLNLLDRYNLANKLVGIENKIRTLNIGDLEKYQLLAYILGCDKDNARDLMNNKYHVKTNNLDNYFDELGLNK